jgi:hypothetical protein
MNVYHADLTEAQADPALAALFAPGPGVTPFDRLDWLRLMSDACLQPARCFLAVARDSDAVAALPLCETPGGLTALANWYSFIARPRGTCPPLLEAIMRSLAGDGAIDFAPLPAPEAAMLHNAARAAGWFARLTPVDRNHVLELGGADFATWWATRPGQLRETVRRKGRRITVSIAHAFAPADWNTYEAIYAKSWKPAEGSPAFLRRFAQAEGAAGRLRLGLARIDGVPVAAQFWTVEDRTAFIHKLAHDPAADAHSPGTVLTHAMFAAAIDKDRVNLIDFGTGDDAYKRDWVNTVRLRYRLEACHPRALRHWPKLGKLVAKSALHFCRPNDKAAP